MPAGYSYKDRGWAKIQEAIKDLATRKLDCGVHGDDGSDIVEIATYQEFGTESIPERSFIRSTLKEQASAIRNKTILSVRGIITGRGSSEAELRTLGLFLETKMKEKVLSGNFTPLSWSTIKAKGSDKPLIDTGRLLGSIRYVIK
jgi:hypothetical protein